MKKINILILVVLFAIVSAGTVAACYKPEVTQTPTVSPIPTDEVLINGEVTVTPEVTTEPTLTLEPTLTAGQSAEVHGDGLSDGKSSCPDCTKPHNNPVQPSSAPATGRAE